MHCNLVKLIDYFDLFQNYCAYRFADKWLLVNIGGIGSDSVAGGESFLNDSHFIGAVMVAICGGDGGPANIK